VVSSNSISGGSNRKCNDEKVKVHLCLVTRSLNVVGDVEVMFLSFLTWGTVRMAGLFASKYTALTV